MICLKGVSITPAFAMRTSPDTDGLLMVPALEYLATTSPVLGQVERDEQTVGLWEAVSTLRRRQDERVP